MFKIFKKEDENFIVRETKEGLEVNDKKPMSTFIQSIAAIRQCIIERVGLEFYEAKLETFDPDLADALREAEIQTIRADYKEAELEYYKACNDPNGFHGPQLLQMHERLNKMKERYEAVQQGLQQVAQQPLTAQTLASGLTNNPEDDLDENNGRSYSQLEHAAQTHSRPDISLSTPMSGTLPSLPISFD